MIKKLSALLITYLLLAFSSFADLPEILIKPNNEQYTRLSSGLAGSNISIIDETILKENYNKNLPQILEMYSGVEIRRLYDGVEGTNSSIDMRGFGEASKSNVLILVNGNRLNEIDMANISFSHIPITSIERIEIVRGGSAATIYGSGAVGGSINVITKNDIIEDTVNLSIGSYNARKIDFNTGSKIDENSAISFSASAATSDTFRDAADYENQNFIVNYKNKITDMIINLDLFLSFKEQDLPGPRVKGGEVYNYHFCNRYEDSRTAKHIGGSFATNGDTCNTNQRDDYAEAENMRINANVEYTLDELNKFFVNLGYKDRLDKAFLAANANTNETPSNGDRYLKTETDNNLFNLRYETKQVEEDYSNILNLGFEIGHAFYNSDRHRKEDEQLGQNYHADLKARAFYVQNTTYYNELDLAMSLGARHERSETGARDEVYRTVAGFVNSWDATDHDTYNNNRNNTAFNIGIEKGVNKNLSIYGSYSESFRIPNIDEHIKATTSGNFHLEDQESDGIEIGLLYQNDQIDINASYYNMDTKNEIQYNQSVNTNLDPIERQGINIDLDYMIDEKQKIMSSFNYTEAEFTSGTLTPGSGGAGTCNYDNTTYCSNSSTWQNLMGGGTSYSLAGKSVPLVSPITYSINYVNKLRSDMTFNLGIKYNDKKYVSNDQENIEPKIPDYYLINTSLSSNKGPYVYKIGINNLTNEKIYDFAISSTFHDDAHYGLSNVYPLPERNYFVDFKYTF